MDWKKPLGAAVSDYTPNVAGFATLTFADYFGELTEADDLACLTLDTAGACDLKCEGMCYHHPSIRVTDREVSMRPLTRAIEDAWRTLAMKTLVVSGNEPFLNPRRLFQMLEFSGTLPGRDFATGIVTNERHIERHWDRLPEVAARESDANSAPPPTPIRRDSMSGLVITTRDSWKVWIGRTPDSAL